MRIRVNILCNDCRVSGWVDAPKIKNRNGREHFSLLALLNYPKLGTDWFQLRKEVIVVRNARIDTLDGKFLRDSDQVHIRPGQIIAAQGGPLKTNRDGSFLPLFSGHRTAFRFLNGMQVEGELFGEMNRLVREKGRHFLSLSNVMVVKPEGDRLHVPFMAINHARAVPAAKNVACEEALGAA